MKTLKRLWNEQKGLVSPKDLMLVAFGLTAILIAGVTSFSGSGGSQSSSSASSAGSKDGSEIGYTGIRSQNAATAGSGFEDMTDAMGVAVFVPPDSGDDDDDGGVVGDDDDDDGGVVGDDDDDGGVVGDDDDDSGSEDALTQGYWKNHPDAWPVDSLTLGDETYSKAEAIDILKTPAAGGDASLILAYQLIAAKLNIANGVDGSSVANTVAEADALLSGGGRLPQGVTSSSANPNRQQMIDAGAVLDAFNNSGH